MWVHFSWTLQITVQKVSVLDYEIFSCPQNSLESLELFMRSENIFKDRSFIIQDLSLLKALKDFFENSLEECRGCKWYLLCLKSKIISKTIIQRSISGKKN